MHPPYLQDKQPHSKWHLLALVSFRYHRSVKYLQSSRLLHKCTMHMQPDALQTITCMLAACAEQTRHMSYFTRIIYWQLLNRKQLAEGEFLQTQSCRQTIFPCALLIMD